MPSPKNAYQSSLDLGMYLSRGAADSNHSTMKDFQARPDGDANLEGFSEPTCHLP